MQSIPIALVSTTRASMSFPAATVTARLYRRWLGRQRSTSLPWTPLKWTLRFLMASWKRSSSRFLRRLSRASRIFALICSSSMSISVRRRVASSFCRLASRSSSWAAFRSASVFWMLLAILSRRVWSSFWSRTWLFIWARISSSCFWASAAPARANSSCRVICCSFRRGRTLAAAAASLTRSYSSSWDWVSVGWSSGRASCFALSYSSWRSWRFFCSVSMDWSRELRVSSWDEAFSLCFAIRTLSLAICFWKVLISSSTRMREGSS
mmetsp:Transcript_5376/g.13245  ORF Transcript_5376/g.13245 Transcript_5376/m.13245 type:complete len:266 (-) Transcript_5376:384-1181(-)